MELLATFFTHYGAMSFYKRCKELGMPAKMAPVPRELSASCGVCVRFAAVGSEGTEDAPGAKDAADAPGADTANSPGASATRRVPATVPDERGLPLLAGCEDLERLYTIAPDGGYREAG